MKDAKRVLAQKARWERQRAQANSGTISAKKKDFVERWCAIVSDGRKRNYPEISPAEMAAHVWYDQRVAQRIWRKYKLNQATPEQIERILSKDRTIGPGSSQP